MDYFTNLLATFLDMGAFQLLSMEGLKALRFKQKHLNLFLTGLERYQGEYLMTSFLGELNL